MTSDLYRIRLYFDAHIKSTAHRGVAKYESIEVKFVNLPQIAGLPKHLTLIDFAPQVRAWELRVSAERRREMYATEVSAVTEWLVGIEVAAIKAMGG